MTMSFIGSMGHLMAGSGLKELLELIYTPNAVDHILTGEAVSRAVRAHILLDTTIRINAERMGNWSLHLEAVLDMLPYLAASGHSLYSKSAGIYMQTILSWGRTIQMCTVTWLGVSMSPVVELGLDCPLT